MRRPKAFASATASPSSGTTPTTTPASAAPSTIDRRGRLQAARPGPAQAGPSHLPEEQRRELREIVAPIDPGVAPCTFRVDRRVAVLLEQVHGRTRGLQ